MQGERGYVTFISLQNNGIADKEIRGYDQVAGTRGFGEKEVAAST